MSYWEEYTIFNGKNYFCRKYQIKNDDEKIQSINITGEPLVKGRYVVVLNTKQEEEKENTIILNTLENKVTFKNFVFEGNNPEKVLAFLLFLNRYENREDFYNNYLKYTKVTKRRIFTGEPLDFINNYLLKEMNFYKFVNFIEDVKTMADLLQVVFCVTREKIGNFQISAWNKIKEYSAKIETMLNKYKAVNLKRFIEIAEEKANNFLEEYKKHKNFKKYYNELKKQIKFLSKF